MLRSPESSQLQYVIHMDQHRNVSLHNKCQLLHFTEGICVWQLWSRLLHEPTHNAASVSAVYYYNPSVWYLPGSAGSLFVSGLLCSACSSTPSVPPGHLASGNLRVAAHCPGSWSDRDWRTHWSGSTRLEVKQGVDVLRRMREFKNWTECHTTKHVHVFQLHLLFFRWVSVLVHTHMRLISSSNSSFFWEKNNNKKKPWHCAPPAQHPSADRQS